MEIRRAHAGDATAIERCIHEAYSPYTERIGRAPAALGVAYAPLIADDRVVVCVVGGDVIGCVSIVPGAGEVEIRSLAILPAHQRKGYGRELVRRAEEEARARGLGRVGLFTNARLPALVTYYESLGFVEVGRRTESGYDRVYMSKSVETP